MSDESNEAQNQDNEPKTAPEEASTSVTEPTTAPETSLTPPPAKPTEAETDTQTQSSTVVLVWQWLTYGLWTWTLASLGVLLSATLAYFIASDANRGDYTWQVYVIATALCLLPISYLIDRTYRKHEPVHKHGFAAVILVLHAVFAFLVSIGSLITAVVTLLSLATDTSGDAAVKTTVIISALLIAALGGLFFVRIVRPPKFEFISRKFGLIVSVIAAVTIVAALAGPYVATIKSRTDRQIESGLYGVNSAIQSYAQENKKLPASLDDLTFSSYQDNSETIVKKGLVSYVKKDEVPQSGTYSYGRTFRYELCVTYKKSKGGGKAVPAQNASSPTETYNSGYLDTYSHPAGHLCYKQSAYVSGGSTYPASDIKSYTN